MKHNESNKKWFASKQALIIVVVAVIGIVLAVLILNGQSSAPAGDEHGNESGEHQEGNASGGADRHDENESQKGPHGGKLFKEASYAIEVTIFEQGSEPQFRLYTYENNKALDPAQNTINVSLQRLGRPPEEITFAKQNDYLKGNTPVNEPHSFTVTIHAQYNNKSYQFTYAQQEEQVTMSDQQLKASGVEISSAGPARIQSTLALIGEVRLNEDQTVHIVPRLSGVVESVSANAGDRVKKGQLLAVISSQVLADQRSDLLAALKRLALARVTHEREKKLWEEKISAQQDFLEAQSAMQEAEIVVQSAQQKLTSLGGGLSRSGALTRYEIRAPIDGVITDKRIAVGEVVKEDANIFVVADLSTVWAEMIVPVNNLNQIKVGQTATIKATAFDAQGQGTVSYVGSLVGEQTRTAIARIVLPNPQRTWHPGLPITINVVSAETQVPVAISVDALQSVRDWTAVFVRYGDYLEARPLTLGRSDGKLIEVVSGLNAGESYAAKNSFLIKAELGKSAASHDH